MNGSQVEGTGRRNGVADYVILGGLVGLLGAGLLVYSQTWSFANDEGFHLVAAQLIGQGQRPYLDFFFPQTPLNAYWNAAWMGLFGLNWRVTHAVAALTVTVAVMLLADHVYRRCPEPAWKLPAAATAALCFGLNEVVVMFGTLAQAYALCLALIVGAFLCAAAAARRQAAPRSAALDAAWTGGAGCCAAAAAAASLLTAPVAPVLLVWLMWQSRSRIATFATFCAGAVVPLLPLLWLFAHGPFQVFFDIVEYHGLFRQLDWPGAPEHNVEVYLSWIDSGHALALIGLAAAALLLAWRGERLRDWRAELVLCAALAAAQAAYLSTILPTHQRYYLFAVPWLAMLASAGLCGLVGAAGPRRAAVAALGVFLALATAKTLFDARDDYVWSDAEAVAANVEEVTPRDVPIVAEEAIYFLTRRTPPRGLEHSDAFKLSLPDSARRLLHLTSKDELAREIREGRFATVELCDDDIKDKIDPGEVFSESREFEDDECVLYWRFKPRQAQAAEPRK